MKNPIILTGKVVHGKELGRTVGMPTANLHIIDGTLPAPGVYATRICIGGTWFFSVTNIGTRPSVDNDQTVTIETHILDFERMIYDEVVTLEVHEFLRPIQRFKSLEAVQQQVRNDISQVRKIHFKN